MSESQKSFLNLLYSLCKQYISWYEREIKNKPLDDHSIPPGGLIIGKRERESLQYKPE